MIGVRPGRQLDGSWLRKACFSMSLNSFYIGAVATALVSRQGLPFVIIMYHTAYGRHSSFGG